MMNYDRLISTNLKGETPKEQYENLIEMKHILQITAYPRRGTKEEDLDELILAKLIQDKFTAEDLEVKTIDNN
jgi:hypothetical protein